MNMEQTKVTRRNRLTAINQPMNKLEKQKGVNNTMQPEQDSRVANQDKTENSNIMIITRIMIMRIIIIIIIITIRTIIRILNNKGDEEMKRKE